MVLLFIFDRAEDMNGFLAHALGRASFAGIKSIY